MALREAKNRDEVDGRAVFLRIEGTPFFVDEVFKIFRAHTTVAIGKPHRPADGERLQELVVKLTTSLDEGEVRAKLHDLFLQRMPALSEDITHPAHLIAFSEEIPDPPTVEEMERFAAIGEDNWMLVASFRLFFSRRGERWQLCTTSSIAPEQLSSAIRRDGADIPVVWLMTGRRHGWR